MKDLIINVLTNEITEKDIPQTEMEKREEEGMAWQEEQNKPKPPSVEEQLITVQDENAELMLQNAIQDMNITTLQDENAELMFRLANLEMGAM